MAADLTRTADPIPIGEIHIEPLQNGKGQYECEQCTQSVSLPLSRGRVLGPNPHPRPPAEPPKFYNLEFQVKEVEAGKVVNGRSYYMMISSESNPAQLRTGGKIPYTTGSANQFNFFEVGVNIDCRAARERGGELALMINADVSSILPPPEGAANAPPMVRQNRWGSNVIVPLRKPTVIFSSDDATGKRKMQLELTATPIS